MMQAQDKCPLCWNKFGGASRMTGSSGNAAHLVTTYFECDLCGRFGVPSETLREMGMLDRTMDRLTPNNPLSRTRLIQYARQNSPKFGEAATPMTLEDIGKVATDFVLPSPVVQSANIIRWIGDRVSKTGQPIEELPWTFFAEIGAPDQDRAGNLLIELISAGLAAGIDVASNSRVSAIHVDLTLAGWERYEHEKRGRFAGNYGFIALKFGDSILDPFLSNHVKPGIKTHIGYDLIDMRDAAKAGIIDNLMREKIRDAAFVLVDLTHENSGSYWEAGYAEGLGKPVLYICERTKFEAAKTHFDTNHLTTVLWEADKPAEFIEQLIATLRRSLNLFPAS
jgi:hypothetical protein